MPSFEEFKSLIKPIGHTNKHLQISASEYLQESMSLPHLGAGAGEKTELVSFDEKGEMLGQNYSSNMQPALSLPSTPEKVHPPPVRS